jgi:phospholipid/cholesterol/gamma-HCH transport system substrate-binding protein
MASLRTKLSVGLFLIAGTTFAIIAVIWLGMSNYLEKGQYFVAYFDESVQGLDKDSPVKYRGVSIGRVNRIAVAPDEELIEVILKIESGLQPTKGLAQGEIVAQLKSVGITGLMFVELDRRKADEPDRSPQLDFTPPYPRFPTRPSDISQLFASIEEVLGLFTQLDIKGLSSQLESTLAVVSQAIEAAHMGALSDDIRNSLQRIDIVLDSGKWHQMIDAIKTASDSFTTLTHNANVTVAAIDETVRQTGRIVADREPELEKALQDLQSAMHNANQLSVQGRRILHDVDTDLFTLANQAAGVLRRMEVTTKELNRLIDRISDQPSQLLFGDPYPPRKAAP